MPSRPDPLGDAFERLRPRLTAISRRIVGSQAEAEDIVQDSYLKWRRADRAALLEPVAWLTTVVRHGSIDRLRRRARDEAAAQGARELAPLAANLSPDEIALRHAELGEAYARLRARLSPAERLALVLHEVFECSHADIAAVLGTRAANARQYLARARRRLRAHGETSAPEEKRCRELVRRFQAAINDMDLPAMVSLLDDEQPVTVQSPAPRLGGGRTCANDAQYRVIQAG